MKQKTFLALVLALIMATMQTMPLQAQSTSKSQHSSTITKSPSPKVKHPSPKHPSAKRDTAVIWCEMPEQMPFFRGGRQALMEWVKENMKYPDELAETCVQGRVIVTFIINEDGTVTDGKVIKSVHPLLDAEALRLVSIMPRWFPHVLNGKARKMKYTMPFNFQTE